MILSIALHFSFACFALALLMNLWQLVRSRHIPDRILALDTMTLNMIGLVVLYGIFTRTGLNFEIALLIAMTGFVSTVAYCKFVLRGNIIE